MYAHAQQDMRRLNSSLAKQCEEMLLLQRDITTSIRVMRIFFDKYAKPGGHQQPEDDDTIVGAALFRDGVVQFIACFDPSLDYHIDSRRLYPVNPSKQFFRWMKDQRDAYAAHRFGAQRQCVVGPIRDHSGQLQSGQLIARFQCPSKEEAPNLLIPMEKAEKFVEGEVKELLQKLKDVCQAMTEAEFNALPPARTKILGPDESRVSRNNIQRILDGKAPSQRKRS